MSGPSRRAVRLVTAVGVVLSAGLAFVPLARADTPPAGAATSAPTTEAWYQPNPSCAGAASASPAGCVSTGALPVTPPTAPPTSPYPAGTLHVGWGSANETARTYLAFPFADTASQGTITAAALTVPLDTSQADGSVTPSALKAQVCLTTGLVTAADGSVDTPPTADCSASAPLTYVPTPAPHLTADLAPLLANLPTATALVLLPTTKNGTTDTWSVVFNAHTRTGSGLTGPAALALTVSTAPQPTQPAALPIAPPPPPAAPARPVTVPAPAPAALPALPGPAAPAALPALPSTAASAVSAPQVASAAPSTPVVSAPQFVTVGYAYPQVWLLPLAFLILVPLVGRVLTRDLTPTG